jgi:hypothetical protein
VGEKIVYGENFAFGLIDICDNPKWDFLSHVRRANLSAASIRLNSAKAP